MLKYEIAFENPLLFLVFLAVPIVLLVPYFRTPKNKRRTIGRIFALGAHMLAFAMLTFLLAEPTIVKVSPMPQNEAIVIVVDCSKSLEGDISDDRDDDMAMRINRYVDDLVSSKAPETQVQLVKFAGDAFVATSGFTKDGNQALREYNRTSLSGVGKTDSTNINAALRKAASLFTSDMNAYKRIILVSDGRETTGSAWEAAASFGGKIRLDTVMFDVTKEEGFSEVSLLSLSVAPDHTVSAGTTIRLTVEIYSSVETDGVLNFWFGDEEENHFRYPVNIIEGRNIFSEDFKTTTEEIGMRELRVRYAPKYSSSDNISANNELSTWLKITGKPNVLLVGKPEQTEKLYNQVSSIYNTDQIEPENFPTTMQELLKYDEIVLMDVHSTSLHDEADDLLKWYIHDIGRGLLTTSGTTHQSYMSYTDEESLIADMLPVSMTLDQTEQNVAFVLVIDDSSSMIPGAYNQAGADKFEPAKEGAEKVIMALGPNDYIGVVTFHQEATVQMELVKRGDDEHAEELVDFVKSLSALNHFNTDYSKGLNEARDMLANFDGAQSKHVIFLSDGYPNQGDYSQLPSSMKNAGIAVSTIALLADNGAKQLLANIAIEGGGQSFAIDNDADLSNLSNIMENLAFEAKELKFINDEPFTPVVGKDTGVLNQVDAANMVFGGYIGSTLKSGAVTPLRTKDNRPVLAEWDYGAGHVTTLMMDISSSWCLDLFSEQNNGFGLIRNLVHQSMKDNDVLKSGIKLKTRQVDRNINISADIAFYLDGKDNKVKVKIFDSADFYVPDGTDPTAVFNPTVGGYTAELVLSPVGGQKYAATYIPGEDAEPNRNCYICVIHYVEDTEIVNGEEVVVENILDWNVVAHNGGILDEYDVYNMDGKQVMDSLASVSGGENIEPENINQLFSIEKVGIIEISVDIMLPVCIVVAGLLFVDILTRLFSGRRKSKKR